MNKPPRNITFGSPGKGISLGSSADEPSLSSGSVFVMFDQRLRLAVVFAEGTAASQKEFHSTRLWANLYQLTEATVGRRREPSCCCQQFPTSCAKFEETDLVDAHFTHVKQRNCRAQRRDSS